MIRLKTIMEDAFFSTYRLSDVECGMCIKLCQNSICVLTYPLLDKEQAFIPYLYYCASVHTSGSILLLANSMNGMSISFRRCCNLATF